MLMIIFSRGRHASKLTEEEEDEECLKEEEGGFSTAGGTRLVSQPSCKFSLVRSPYCMKALHILVHALT